MPRGGYKIHSPKKRLCYNRVHMITLPIKKLYEDAKVPTFAHPGDAGMDLYAREAITIPAGQKGIVPTGVAMAIPEGYVGLIWDKSGVAIKGGVKVLGGVIDAGYRGEVMVGMINLSDADYTFEAGHKVAQMIIQERIQPEVVEVADLDATSRGEGGFGSTGK